MGWRRVRLRPAPGFAGIAYHPDVPDPAAGDLERAHRHGDAVLFSRQIPEGASVFAGASETLCLSGIDAGINSAPARSRG